MTLKLLIQKTSSLKYSSKNSLIPSCCWHHFERQPAQRHLWVYCARPPVSIQINGNVKVVCMLLVRKQKRQSMYIQVFNKKHRQLRTTNRCSTAILDTNWRHHKFPTQANWAIFFYFQFLEKYYDLIIHLHIFVGGTWTQNCPPFPMFNINVQARHIRGRPFSWHWYQSNNVTASLWIIKLLKNVELFHFNGSIYTWFGKTKQKHPLALDSERRTVTLKHLHCHLTW